MKEVVDLRKKREKHFRNDDGSFVAYMYDEDVHYLKDGKYVDIDNTLISKDNSYENKDNDFKVKFDGKSLFELSKGSHFLKLSLLDDVELKMEKDGENIKFINIFDGIDFIYNLVGSKVKENIIIKNIENVKKSFDFKIETDLNLSLNEKNGIVAKSDDEVVFQFEVPFMYDSNKSFNSKLYYELQEYDNYYVLNLFIDYEWLNKANILFPVIIDPTIYDGSTQNVDDAFIYSNDPNTSMTPKIVGKIGVDSNGIYRSLLKFALPTISSDCNIISAYVHLEALISGAVPPTGYVQKTVSVHEITSSWDENQVTWNSFNNCYEPKIEEVFSAINWQTLIHQYANQFYITNLVKKWYSTGVNNGILLKCFDETYNSNSDIFQFHTKEYDLNYGGANRAYLVIHYRKQSGILNYMSYNDINYNTGVSKINNFNGNIVNQFYINKTINSKLPVNLSVVYNSCNKDLLETINIAKGWKFNIVETIVTETINNETLLKYTDSSGAIFYFYPKVDSNNNIINNIYVDEDSLNIEIVYENNLYKMYDMYNNQKEFVNINNVYYLNKIKDNQGNEINLTFTGTQLTKIVDSNLSEININYLNSSIEIISDYETSIIQLSNLLLNSILTKDGTVTFLYNSSNSITKITDTNGIYNIYEYYTVSPQRFKKIINYGLNDSVGKSMEYTYQNLVTTILFNTNKKTVYTFDNDGHTKNTKSFYGNNDSLYNVYASINEYIPSDSIYNTKNKLSNSKPMLKYVKNLLVNGDFEDTIDKCNFSITEASISDYYAYNGNNSLRLNPELGSITFPITETDDYTLSFHLFLNDLYSELAYISFKLYSYKNGIKTQVDEFIINEEPESTDLEFDISLTGYFESGSTLILEEEHQSIMMVFVDDMQLEKGRVASINNMVRNSDFSNGTTYWDFTLAGNDYSIITLSNGDNALKINSNPSKEIIVTQSFKVNGKQGEKYALSFWYKNEGRVEYPYEYEGNTVTLNLFGVEYGSGIPFIPLLTHCKEWQCETIYFTASQDFESIILTILSLREINDFYITNVMLCRDLRETKYYYDENGRIIEYSGLDDSCFLLNYDNNNQLISVFNPKGNNFKYEYDNIKPSIIKSGISPTGITNEIKYNQNGYPVKTIICNTNPNKCLISGNYYLIRGKGTDKYLTFDKNLGLLKLQEDSCNHLPFKITLVNENKYNILVGQLFLNYVNNSVILSNNNLTSESLFIIQSNYNGSYSIIPSLDYSKNLAVNDSDFIYIENKDVNNSKCQFYFEDISTPLYIENRSYYTQDGKFITSLIDSLGNENKYNYNSLNGLLIDSTNPLGFKKEYSYNLSGQLTNISFGNRQKSYQYNNYRLLSKIISNNNEYDFIYDDFLNNQCIKINNNTLVSHCYLPNNGNLFKSIYGNGDEIEYDYDDLERLSKISKNNVEYNYFYNNFGKIVKILSNNDNYEYIYDLSQRLISYLNDDFKIDYTYDANSNIINKKYYINSVYPFLDLSYEYNEDDSIVKVTINNNIINYNYDYLGRLINKNLDNNLNVEYYYKTIGNKTSLILDSIKIDNDTYRYEYDHLYNITKIFFNDVLINEFAYDSFSELIEEKNYLNDRIYKYIYDNNGNILKKYEKDFNNVLINYDVYEYSNNNWKDQLTKYNNITITYDNIGNPISIGNATLTWQNGRELQSYNDTNLNISYSYNLSGIRTSKIVNSVETKYYLDGKDLILEKKGNNMLYFLRDDKGELIGFKYNDLTYYYKKNFQKDIIGIYDSNFNLIVTYCYDSWGNILSVKDSLENEIFDYSHIAHINPFRYRSYYYDKETNLYYLNTRYYNPVWGRFLNADSSICSDSMIDSLYCYCNNNPVSGIDNNGNFFLLATALVGAVTGAVIGGVIASSKGKSITKGALIGAGVGAVVGLAAGAAVSYLTTGSALSSTVAVLGTVSYNLSSSGNVVGTTISKGIDKISNTYEKVHTSITGNANIYRAVSEKELENINELNAFSTTYKSMDAKQFGFSFVETLKYAKQCPNEYTAIVKSSIPENLLDKFYTIPVDNHIFKHGTLTVYGELIDIFNSAIDKISQIL